MPKFPHKIFVVILRDIIGLENFLLSFSQSQSNFRCVICTGVTLFALVLHLNCTVLSQSESSNFFMYIINNQTNSHNLKTLNWIYLQWLSLPFKNEKR